MIKGAIFGAGFIGLNFINYGLNKDYNFSVLDIKDKPINLSEKIDWVKGDILNIKDVKRTLNDAEIAYYFISQHQPENLSDYHSAINFNISGAINFLKACVEKKVKRVIFISSAAVYGNQSNLPIAETSPTDPINTYGIYKLIIEKFFYLYKEIYNLDTKIMRLSNPYGPGQDINGKQGIIAISIGKSISGEPLDIKGNGSFLRDFIYIDDVMDALNLLSITKNEEVVFNIGSGVALSLNKLLNIISKKNGKAIKTNYLNSGAGNIRSSQLDISKARKLLNFEPKISIEDGIFRLLQVHLNKF